MLNLWLIANQQEHVWQVVLQQEFTHLLTYTESLMNHVFNMKVMIQIRHVKILMFAKIVSNQHLFLMKLDERDASLWLITEDTMQRNMEL